MIAASAAVMLLVPVQGAGAATTAVVAVPAAAVPAAAVPADSRGADVPAAIASAKQGRKKGVKRAIERFKVVPWRDGEDRSRLAVVLVVRYPKARRTLSAAGPVTGKLNLKVGRPGHVVVRAHDVAQVPVWRPGARPRAVHVLKFSARQSRRLARHGAVRAWGARPPDWYAGISLTLESRSEAVASVAGWLPFPNPVDWAMEQWAKRDAACREPLPPEDRWTGDDRKAYLECAVVWVVLPVDQGVPAHLRRTYSGNFASCSPRMRESRKTWELEVRRWDARFTMSDYDVTRKRRFVEASLDMTARRYGRDTTYELHGARWETDDSWLRGLLPLTMSVADADPPRVEFVRNCPWGG